MSAVFTALTPSSRSSLRHWPSACGCERTCVSPASVAPLKPEQLMADRHEAFADDEEPALGNQVVHVGDAAGSEFSTGIIA